MVCGSRFRGDPGYKVPIGRRIGNLIFSVVLTVICRQRISDPTSGFRMTNRRGIELFARDYPHDYPEVEAILMLHAHRLRIHEVPVRMNARGFGRSSIDYPRSAYYMAKVLLALFVGLFRRRPTPVEATGEDELAEPPAQDAATERGLRQMIALPLAASHAVGTKAQIVAVIVAAIFLGVVLELVRRRRLVERYALLWMLAAVAMLVLAVWRDGLKTLADAVGVHSPPNALFLVALGVVFILLLHFSIATSRLSEETKILAQEVARLDAEAKAAERPPPTVAPPQKRRLAGRAAWPAQARPDPRSPSTRAQ